MNRDPRERVWYFDDTTFASAFSAFVAGSSPAYDVLALYPPGTPWDAATNTPGAPSWSIRNGFAVSDLTSRVPPLYPACTEVVTSN